jgi:acetyl-CoA C-acetyltransferase
MSKTWPKGEIAIVGVGSHKYGNFPDLTMADLVLSAIKEAIGSCGIDKNDIGAVIVEPCLTDPEWNSYIAWSWMVDALGLGGKCKHNFLVHSGGSVGMSSLLAAGGLIATGRTDTVLIAHAEKLSTPPNPGITQEDFAADVRAIFSTAGMYEEWEVPYGYHFNAIAGLVTHRYMHETGTPIEEIASVVTSNRKWAAKNEKALLRREISVEEVMKSRMVASPLTSRMCNIVCDGATALIVTSAKKARDLVETPAYILGIGGVVTNFSLMTAGDVTRFGWKKAFNEAIENAGVKLSDFGTVELYDSYPVFELIQLEEFGFCERGKSGKFVYDGHTWPGGNLPMTTDGGTLGKGHIGVGGSGFVIQGAGQILGKCGGTQVPDVKYSLVTNMGGDYMDAQVIILGGKRS